MIINDRIKILRSKNDMTLEDLANKIGKTKQTVQKYESGVISNIPSDIIEKLSDALNASPAYIMGWTDDINGEPKNSPLYNALEKLDIKDGDLTNDEINNIVKFVEFIKNNKN